MSEAPNTNWDLIHEREWFRRSEWQPTFRSEKLGVGRGGACKAFVELFNIVGGEVALDCSCGLGLKTLCMSEMNLNVIGSDFSSVAIEHARELAKAENVDVTFFRSSWPELPRNIPHYFDAIYCDSLHLEPVWDRLGAALVGIFHSLKPGGFLMINGAPDGSDEDWAMRDLEELYESEPHERVDWFHRDGGETVCRLLQRRKSENYVDDRLLYVVNKNGESSLDSTTIRRPGYWTWNHWRELTRTAGYCHLETRHYEGYGLGGEDIHFNVAWKSKDGLPDIDDYSRNEPYMD